MLPKKVHTKEIKENINKYSNFTFNEIWNKYPNKDGSKEALKHFTASVRTEEDWSNINLALDNYLAHLNKEQWKRPKNGSTWFNNWKDWIDRKEGKRWDEA